jgi:hypothetical protein
MGGVMIVRSQVFAAALVAAVVFVGTTPWSAEAATTLDTRVKQLELKTDYFKKKNIKVVRQYHRQPAPAATPSACVGSLSMSFNPGVLSVGTAYAWLTATVTYNGDPASIFVNWAPRGFGFPCGRTVGATAGSGTVTLKQYCSFDVDAGDVFTATFETGRGCTGDIVQAISASMKFTLIQVVEPP